PDRSVAAAHDVLPVVGHGPSIGGQTPVARLRSTMASLASLELRSSGVQAKPGAAVTLERASGETSENSGRLDGQTHKPVGAGLDRAPGPAVSPARFQSMMSARVDARRPSQSSPQAGIKTAGSGDANIKMEATQAGRPEVKVTIVHQETHFGSAPLQEMQLAGGRSGRSGTIAQPGQSAIVPASVSSSQPGPMRVLHLHLEPAELGGVVVKMNMKGEALTVQIQPQLPRTALMLRSDSAALNSILQAAGVLADNASVQILEPSSNSHGSGNGMWASSQDADQSGSAQRGNADAGEGQRSGTSEEQDDAKQSVQDGQGDPGLSGVRSELYL
ncbi:MAG: flagellar hook-length control protein FliK, partial [Hyphomicrobiales bacterium]|nr:flagellar hook-length control protein FliK [Hyphomicrobiales bacterium]